MTALLAQLKEIDAKIDALLVNDNLTLEQEIEYEQLSVGRKKSADAIQREKDRLAREEERTRLESEAARDTRAAQERAGRPTILEGNGRLADADTARVVPVVATVDSIPAEVKRYGELKNFKGTRQGRGADVRAYRFGMYVLAMLSMQLPGRFRFRSALEWFDKNLAAVTSKDASGTAYLIPEEFGMDLIDLRESYGVVRRLFNVVPMSSDTRSDPRRQGGLTAYFVSEGGAGTESNKTWDRVQLVAKDIMVLSRYTSQVSEDAAINLGDNLAGEIAYAFSNKEDDCGFNGTGASTYGGIIGLRTKLQDVDGAGTDSAGLIAGAGNSWGALTLANFDSVVGALPQYADTPAACWAMHRTFYYTVVEKLVQASGGVTAMEVREGNRRPRPIFKGYPVEFAQIFPASSASGQVTCTLGDHGLAASFGDRQQDSIAFSEHATIGGESLFERNQIAIRGTERVDVNVHDVGTSAAAGPVVGLATT